MIEVTSEPVAKLRWETSRLAWGIPIYGFLMGGAAWLALSPVKRTDAIAESRRGGGLILRVVEPLSIAGVNLPLLALTLFFGWLLFRLVWRWADKVAVSANRHGLNFHPSIRQPQLEWGELVDIRFFEEKRIFVVMRWLDVKSSRGRRVRVGPVGGEASAFIDEVEQFRGGRERSLSAER